MRPDDTGVESAWPSRIGQISPPSSRWLEFHIFACRTPAQAVNQYSRTAPARHMSRSQLLPHRSTARSLHHWLSPPLVELDLHLHRRKPVHLLLQHVLLLGSCHQRNCPSMWALFDRWRPFDRWTEKRGFPLPPPPSRAHPSVQAVLPDSRDQHPRPTAHARLTGHGQCPCASHICCRSTPDHPRPSAEGSRRDRTSPLSPSVSRVARGAQPRARILGGVMHVRAASRFLNPRPEDLVHPRAFSRCSCSQYPTGLVIPAPNAAPPLPCPFMFQAEQRPCRHCSNFCLPGRRAVGVASGFTNAGCLTMSGDAHPTSGCRAWTNQVHLTRFSRAPPVSATELAGPMAGPQPHMAAVGISE